MSFSEWIQIVWNWIRHPSSAEATGAIATAGYPLMAIIIFVETGLLFPLLPGDSMLVFAGIFAAKGTLNIWLIQLWLIPCAIAGDAVSYWLGRKSGPMIFNRSKSKIFNPEHVEKARAFYDKHGGKSIIIARFMPIVRTFVPVIAGVAQMPYKQFGFYNIIGGVAWISSMSFLGYFLGGIFPQIATHIEKVIIVVVFLSIAPGIYAWFKAMMDKRKTAGQ